MHGSLPAYLCVGRWSGRSNAVPRDLPTLKACSCAAGGRPAAPPATSQPAILRCTCPHQHPKLTPTPKPTPTHPPARLQAIQFVAEHGEVCPAGWKPGDKTMVADPEKSLEYFSGTAADKEVRAGW